MKTYCQLVVPSNGKYTRKWREEILGLCLKDPRISRVTSHNFYKIKAFEEIKFPHSKWIITEDKTKHFDETVWAFASQYWAYVKNHGKRGKKNQEMYIPVLIHYLLNLEGIYPETEWFLKMAGKRKKLEKSKKVNPEVDHGWEIKELKKAGIYARNL